MYFLTGSRPRGLTKEVLTFTRTIGLTTMAYVAIKPCVVHMQAATPVTIKVWEFPEQPNSTINTVYLFT